MPEEHEYNNFLEIVCNSDNHSKKKRKSSKHHYLPFLCRCFYRGKEQILDPGLEHSRHFESQLKKTEGSNILFLDIFDLGQTESTMNKTFC